MKNTRNVSHDVEYRSREDGELLKSYAYDDFARAVECYKTEHPNKRQVVTVTTYYVTVYDTHRVLGHSIMRHKVFPHDAPIESEAVLTVADLIDRLEVMEWKG